MTRTAGTTRTIVAVLMAILVGLLAVACRTNSGTPPTSTMSTALAFPYAPFEIRTDVAVPLDQPLLDAARFALDMSVDARVKNDPAQTAVYNRYRTRIAPEADTPDLRAPDTFVGETGGALHRAVAADELPSGEIEVSICLYDTPGLYAMEQDGTLVPARSADELWRPRVLWTNRPAADGSTPTEPRWLLTDDGTGTEQEATAAVCDPFKPEPFIQEPPRPTSASTTPTR